MLRAGRTEGTVWRGQARGHGPSNGLASCPAVSHEGSVVSGARLVIWLKTYACCSFQTLDSHFPLSSLVGFLEGGFRKDWVGVF